MVLASGTVVGTVTHVYSTRTVPLGSCVFEDRETPLEEVAGWLLAPAAPRRLG